MIYIGWQDRDIRDLIRPLSCPVVYAYCFSSLDDRSWISYDNDLAMEEILDRVLSLGHKRIAFIGGVDENCYPTAKRLKVYQDTLAAANIPLRREYIKFGDWSFNDGKRFYRDFRSLEEPPTAILSLNDYMAAGVIEESMTTDRKVLDEISVVGFNGLEFVEFLYPFPWRPCACPWKKSATGRQSSWSVKSKIKITLTKGAAEMRIYQREFLKVKSPRIDLRLGKSQARRMH